MDSAPTIVVAVLVFAVALALWRSFAEIRRAPEGYHCLSCGSTCDTPRTRSPLSGIAIAIWIVAIIATLAVSWLFVLVGLLGQLVAYLARRSVCPTCQHDQLVPAHTPAAKAHAATLRRTSSP